MEFKISLKPSPDELIKMRNDYKLNPEEWIKQALDKNMDITKILEIVVNISKNDSQMFNAFFTPDSLSNKMFQISGIYQDISYQRINKKKMRILEFSGGVGNIIFNLLDDIDEKNYKYLEIDFVEINPDFFNIAKARLDKYKDFINFYNIDFFKFKNKYEYDYIIGNPPFKIKNDGKDIYDVDFYNKSWDMLKDYGSMLIIMSPSSLTLKTKSHIKFKELLPETDKKELIDSGYLYINDEKFDKKEKGVKAGLTNIQTYFYNIQKEELQEEPEPAKDLNKPANIIQNAIRQKRARKEFNTLKNKKSKSKELISSMPEPEKKKKGRPAKIKKEVEPPKFVEITDDEKALKKELGNLVSASSIFNIDWFIENIKNSKDSYRTKINKVNEELTDQIDYLGDRTTYRNEATTKKQTKKKLDKLILYLQERIDKLKAFVLELNQSLFDLKNKKKKPSIELPQVPVIEPPQVPVIEPPSVPKKQRKPRQIKIKKPEDCPDEKILNSQSNRCVKRTSKKGKEIIFPTLSLEEQLLIILDKVFPVEFKEYIYDIDEDIEQIKKSKNKLKDVKDTLILLNYYDELVKDLVNNTKSINKRNILYIFINYNNYRIQKVQEYYDEISKEEPKPPIELVEEVKEEIKKNKLVCSDINVIPQFTGTCWFNAILMSLLYSQHSRQILLKLSKSWDKKDKLFNIFKTILNRNYTDNEFKKWLNGIKPELILFELLNRYDKEILEGLKKKVGISQDLSNFGLNTIYITNILDYIIPNNKILINFYENKAYLNIDKIVKTKIKKKGETYDITMNSPLTDLDIIEDYNNLMFSKIPNYILIDDSKKYDFIFKSLEKYPSKKNKIDKVSNFKNYISYNKDLENALDNFKKGMLEVNYRDNVYKLDSILIANDNIEIAGHAISGITCDNERYIYNGWDSYTLDSAKSQEDIIEENKDPLTKTEKVLGKRIATPCSLIKYDWDLSKKHENFTLNAKKCELPSNLKNKDLRFNVSSKNKILIYVRTNDEVDEDNDDLDDTEKIEIDIENFIKEIIKNMPERDIYANAIISLSKKDMSDKNIKKNTTYVNTLTKNERYKIVYDYLYERYEIK